MLEKLKGSIAGLRMRFAFGRPDRSPHGWEDDMGLASTGIPVVDSVCARAKITPDRLARIILDADMGEPQEQARLFEVVLEKEPRFAAHLQTRRLAVQGCKWHVQSESDPETAREVEDILRDAGLRGAMGDLLRCIGFGYAGVAVDWDVGGAGIRGFRGISTDRWIFDEAGNPALEEDDGTRRALVTFHPAQILYCHADGMTGLPARNGVLRTLAWLYLFKNTSFTLWNQFLERFGVPFVLGKLPSGDYNDASKRKELLRNIISIRSGGGGVGTTETDMQMLNGASGSNKDAFEAFQRYCDETATLVVLGQLASSDHAGGLSAGSAQDKVRQDILEADCQLVSARFQELVSHLLAFRHGIGKGHDFRFVIDCEKPEDMNQRAQRDAQVAAAAGCALERKYAEETYGIRLEERQQAAMPAVGEGFSDTRRPRVPSGPTAKDRAIEAICDGAIRSLIDSDALEAWRAPIDAAIRKAFGDLDPNASDAELMKAFSERAPAFLESLPGVMDGIDDRELVEAMGHSMLAGYLNGLLPASFWRNKSR